MAKKKRQTKTPAAVPAQVRGGRSLLFALGGAAVLAVIAAIGVAAIVLSSGGDDKGATVGAKKAVIVDQLQLTQPGPKFISDARATLVEAGYTVDYIAGEQVGVETYRTLASRDYDLVILRVHAGITTEVDADTGEASKEEYVSLFTNEDYDESKYPEDQMNRLGKATYTNGSDAFFGIGPEFIKNIPGDFNGAQVILMGCDGLKSRRTAQAFLDKGASAFVGWSNLVSGSFTDSATNALLNNWLPQGLTLENAVAMTADDIGPDPAFAGELRILTS